MPRKPKKRNLNPIRRYKDNEGLTYVQLAKRLGISQDYARKLGAGLRTSVSPAMGRQIEERSHGRIKYLDVMRWIEINLAQEEIRRAG